MPGTDVGSKNVVALMGVVQESWTDYMKKKRKRILKSGSEIGISSDDGKYGFYKEMEEEDNNGENIDIVDEQRAYDALQVGIKAKAKKGRA